MSKKRAQVVIEPRYPDEVQADLLRQFTNALLNPHALQSDSKQSLRPAIQIILEDVSIFFETEICASGAWLAALRAQSISRVEQNRTQTFFGFSEDDVVTHDMLILFATYLKIIFDYYDGLAEKFLGPEPTKDDVLHRSIQTQVEVIQHLFRDTLRPILINHIKRETLFPLSTDSPLILELNKCARGLIPSNMQVITIDDCLTPIDLVDDEDEDDEDDYITLGTNTIAASSSSSVPHIETPPVKTLSSTEEDELSGSEGNADEEGHTATTSSIKAEEFPALDDALKMAIEDLAVHLQEGEEKPSDQKVLETFNEGIVKLVKNQLERKRWDYPHHSHRYNEITSTYETVKKFYEHNNAYATDRHLSRKDVQRSMLRFCNEMRSFEQTVLTEERSWWKRLKTTISDKWKKLFNPRAAKNYSRATIANDAVDYTMECRWFNAAVSKRDQATRHQRRTADIASQIKAIINSYDPKINGDDQRVLSEIDTSLQELPKAVSDELTQLTIPAIMDAFPGHFDKSTRELLGSILLKNGESSHADAARELNTALQIEEAWKSPQLSFSRLRSQ